MPYLLIAIYYNKKKHVKREKILQAVSEKNIQIKWLISLSVAYMSALNIVEESKV